MPLSNLSDEEFVEEFELLGAAELSKKYNQSVRSAYARRSRLENKLQTKIKSPDEKRSIVGEVHGRLEHNLINGTIIVGSDAHYWPYKLTTAHKAFVYFCKKFKPNIIVANGDFLDGASISRHASIGWEHKPSLVDEIETCKERLAEIEAAAPQAKKFWTLGNHDARFENRLANVAPEYARLHGFHLSDHFPDWEPCWSLWVNNNTVIKHRWKGGIHASHNNTVNAGKNIVTGHLHSLKVQPFSDYNGTRFGVDTGTLAEPYDEQFNNYMEDNPRSWRSGFVLLTFVNKKLLWPEIVHVVEENVVDFRGELINVA
tara:strand:- start:144 stop:1088 length:945 start_codon:yes stop_codon:yes gene_type:complete